MFHRCRKRSQIQLFNVVLLSSVLISGCDLGSSWSDQNETRQVDYYKEQCDQNSAALCFRIREESSDAWEIVEQPFTGFDDYIWGQRHQVDVTVSFDDDGSTNHYSVTNLNSSESVSSSEESFAINLYTDAGILVQNSASNWQLGGEIAFDCGTACDDLTAAVANQHVTRLEFSLLTDRSGIALNSVICAAAEADFDSNCEGETQVSWRIGWFQSDCGLAEAAMCLVYKANTSDDYELLRLQDDISGFSPQWGQRYDIDVTKTVSDGGNITAVALDNSDDSPDSREGSVYDFLMVLRGSELEESDSSLIDLYDTDMTLNCSGRCSNINGYIRDDEWLLVRGYVDGAEIQLTDIVCHDESLDDFRTCVDDEDDIFWGI